MKKYFALYLVPSAVTAEWRKMTDEEKKKEGMEEWNKWMKDHQKNFADMGSPLGKTKKITAEGITDTKNDIIGYGIVKAESHEAAAKLFSDNPQMKIPGGSVEIMEVIEMTKM